MRNYLGLGWSHDPLLMEYLNNLFFQVTLHKDDKSTIYSSYVHKD